jgi:CheY-like chemotaxis protein
MEQGTMAEIIIVDDDYASEIQVEHLRFLGHYVDRLSSVDEALACIDRIAATDLLILDIIMPPSTAGSRSSITGGLKSGIVIFQEVRRKNANLPILAYSASTDREAVELFRSDARTTYCAKWNVPSLKQLLGTINQLLGIEEPGRHLTPFIVHGHDDHTKLAVKNYLQNTLGLPEPIILHEQPGQGSTLIEKFERYSSGAHFAIVIVTPDDKVAAENASNEDKRRARQNVIFELGYFLGLFGRSSGRVILLYGGPLELPSDIQGLIYIDISKGIDAAGETIRRELQHVLK